MKHLIPIIILALAIAGTADSVYMTLAHYKVIGLEATGFCPITGHGCSTVISSPHASIAGIPHAILGALYFAVLIAAAVVRIRVGCWFAPWEMLALVLAGFGWSVYLTQELLLQLHIPCPYCLTAHFINTVIVVLYVTSHRNWCT